MFRAMKHRIFLSLALAVSLMGAAPALAADCYADYKAKQEKPLRLHYGVIELNKAACDNRNKAARQIERRISKDGWQLLNVMSLFDEQGLAQRKESAGKYFLRY